MNCWSLIRLALVLPAVLMAISGARAAADQPFDPPTVEYEKQVRKVAASKNGEIKESSGLACSRIVPGLFYTHNDSGDGPRVFAINEKGEDVATVVIAGAQARDWEDMCSFSKGGRHYLIVADVGDNNQQRTSCQLYLIEELAGKSRKGQEPTVAGLKLRGRYDFTYEDGPHNCESVAYDPAHESAILVEKVPKDKIGGPVRVYSLPLSGKRATTARKIGTIPKLPSTATGMDISPDGRRAVITTNIDLIFFDRKENETWGDAFTRGGRAIRAPHGHESSNQGEAVCYGFNGRGVFMTVEKPPCTITELPVTAACEKQWQAFESTTPQKADARKKKPAAR